MNQELQRSQGLSYYAAGRYDILTPRFVAGPHDIVEVMHAQTLGLWRRVERIAPKNELSGVDVFRS